MTLINKCLPCAWPLACEGCDQYKWYAKDMLQLLHKTLYCSGQTLQRHIIQTCNNVAWIWDSCI